MKTITFARVFSPWDKIASSCAVPDCDNFVEEGSDHFVCESCRSNPAAMLARLGIEPQDLRPDDEARQKCSVGYCPIR
jgi:hypothetical protein